MEILTTRQHDMWEHGRLHDEEIQCLTARVNNCLLCEFYFNSAKKHLIGDAPSLG